MSDLGNWKTWWKNYADTDYYIMITTPVKQKVSENNKNISHMKHEGNTLKSLKEIKKKKMRCKWRMKPSKDRHRKNYGNIRERSNKIKTVLPKTIQFSKLRIQTFDLFFILCRSDNNILLNFLFLKHPICPQLKKKICFLLFLMIIVLCLLIRL